MGVVYLAHSAEESFTQTVAFKLIRRRQHIKFRQSCRHFFNQEFQRILKVPNSAFSRDSEPEVKSFKTFAYLII